MNIRSLGIRTDLLFHRALGEVTERDDYLSIRYPRNPDYHWGNYLIFAAPPTPGDEERWLEIFRRELAANRPLNHLLLAWDLGAADPAVMARFAARGLDPGRTLTLSATAVREPPRPNGEVAVRPLASDAEWEEAVRLHALEHGEYDAAGYLEFTGGRFADYRSLVRAGRGAWFGAYLGGRLAGSLGLFHGDGLARYQNVTTHPELRRRGICGTLVHAAARVALDAWGVKTLVMEADPDEEAQRIYESVGFAVVEETGSLYWWSRPGGPPSPW